MERDDCMVQEIQSAELTDVRLTTERGAPALRSVGEALKPDPSCCVEGTWLPPLLPPFCTSGMSRMTKRFSLPSLAARPTLMRACPDSSVVRSSRLNRVADF